jgi:hypothetical protein
MLRVTIEGTNQDEVHNMLDRMSGEPENIAHELAIEMLVKRTDDLKEGMETLLGVRDDKTRNKKAR